MLTQASAFVIRSLRQESRLLSHHVVRGGMVMFMLFACIKQLLESQRLGTSGMSLVSGIAECWYWSLILLGSSYFPAAISEEKEEETLPLLRMTGVRTVTLLLGKSLPRLMVVFLLLLVAAPLLPFAQTFGGVLTAQLIGILLAYLAYAFCLCQAGLLAGVVCRSGQRAVSMMAIFWLLLEFGSWLFWLAALAAQEWRIGGTTFVWLMQSTDDWLWQRTMWSSSASFLMFERGESIWQPQVTFHLAVGMLMFVMSWLLFEPCTRAAHAEGAAATDVKRFAFWKRRRTGDLRATQPALVWKSWRFVVGGWRMLSFQTGLLILISFGTVLLISTLIGARLELEQFGFSLFFVGLLSLAFMPAHSFGAVLHHEVRQQTLVSLCMLPVQRRELVRELLAGVVPCVLPPLSCLTLGFFVLAKHEPGFVAGFGDDVLGRPWTWAILGWAIVTIFLGTLLSAYLRHGAMLLAIAINWIGIPFGIGICLAILAAMTRGGVFDGSEVFLTVIVPVGLMCAEAVACLWMFEKTVARVEELASR